jgi:hypothetical protein
LDANGLPELTAIICLINRIYSNEAVSTELSLREGSWRNVGALDIQLPIQISLSLAGESLTIRPSISLHDDNLFDDSLPQMMIDFEFSEVVNMMKDLMNNLTTGLLEIVQGDIPSFDAGPLGPIDSILDRFGLNFTEFVDSFMEIYDQFASNIESMDAEARELLANGPIAIPGVSSLLQIGSTSESPHYSKKLVDTFLAKLRSAFPSPTHNGVPIPGLPLGQTFEETFTDTFPGKSCSNPFLYLYSVHETSFN